MPVDLKNAYFHNRRTVTPTNQSAAIVFDFLQKPSTLSRMIAYTHNGLPAITGIVAELEEHHGNYPDFDLSDFKCRQAVGRMICFLMHNLGYSVASGSSAKTQLRDFSGAKLFKTSAVYVNDPSITPAYQLVQDLQ